VYYRGDTHYWVMTPKLKSLMATGVLRPLFLTNQEVVSLLAHLDPELHRVVVLCRRLHDCGVGGTSSDEDGDRSDDGGQAAEQALLHRPADVVAALTDALIGLFRSGSTYKARRRPPPHHLPTPPHTRTTCRPGRTPNPNQLVTTKLLRPVTRRAYNHSVPWVPGSLGPWMTWL
jgi:hypothetical protein